MTLIKCCSINQGANKHIQVQNLLSETLGTRHVSEIGIFRISEW
jgi:hypothetical protein